MPPLVRPATAAAETHAEAYRLRAQYSGLDDEVARAALAKDRKVSTQHGGLKRDTPVAGWD
jgi:hypothetical protein